MLTRRMFKAASRFLQRFTGEPKSWQEAHDQNQARIAELEKKLFEVQASVDDYLRFLNAKGSIYLTHGAIDATTIGSESRAAGAFSTVSVGAALSAWSGVTPLQVAQTALMASGADSYWVANAYFDGANWKYYTSTYASRYYQYSTSTGDHIWQTAASGTAGNNVTWATQWTVTNAGNCVVGNAALATNATNGFLYIPTCAGAPSGTPTAYTGRVAMVFDSTNNKLYVYDGGWISATLA